MKKIISVVAIFALVALIFTLAACGGNNNNSTTTTTTNNSTTTTNVLTTLKDEGSSMMDDMSSALGDLADDLTQGGNVTDNDSTTGLLEGLTENNTDSAETDTTGAAE